MAAKRAKHGWREGGRKTIPAKKPDQKQPPAEPDTEKKEAETWPC